MPFCVAIKVLYCATIHFTREIIERIEAPNDVSLKIEDVNSMEIPDKVQNYLCNINNEIMITNTITK